MNDAEYVFGYGSLILDLEDPPTRARDKLGYVTDLRAVKRVWGVAMDNSQDLPGYKYYRLPDGTRPPLFVAFLDIVDTGDSETSVNGVCTPVHHDLLRALDERERNYERMDVTDRIDHPVGRTWAYVGSPEGRARLRDATVSHRAVINARYLTTVEDGFRSLGQTEFDLAAPSLQTGDIPVLDLERIDLP